MKKYHLLPVIAFFILNFNCFGQAFFVGTYTKDESKGIYTYMLNSDGSLDSICLAAEVDNPSFLTLSKDGKYLIAASETRGSKDGGKVVSFRINNTKLEKINARSSGGAGACHVAANEAGFVLCANYGGGNISLHKLSKKGELQGPLDIKQHSGKGTTSRQKGPHAHSTWFAPSKNNVIAVDLGTNELWFYELNGKKGTLESMHPATLSMPEGAGPRHLCFHPNKKWIYVMNELNGSVSRVKKNKKSAYVLKETISSLPEDFKEFNKSADIHISADGKYVYASNRGHNSIAVFAVNEKNGELSIVEWETTEIDTPRNFAISPDGNYLLVANQNNASISSFRINKNTGELDFVDKIGAPEPVCLKF